MDVFSVAHRITYVDQNYNWNGELSIYILNFNGMLLVDSFQCFNYTTGGEYSETKIKLNKVLFCCHFFMMQF